MATHHSIIRGTGKDRGGSTKIRRLLNVFGAYDYTNDKMHVHCYKNNTAKQLVDFLKRVDRRYDDKTIENIFLDLIIFQRINQRW